MAVACGDTFCHVTGLDELADPQAAGVPRGEPRRQRMVGADDLVAIGHVGLGSKEQRAVVGHVLQEIVRVAGHDLHMLAGDAVCFLDHFGFGVAKDDSPVIPPGLARHRGGLQGLELDIDLAERVFDQRSGGGQQHGRRSRTVLRLAEEVGCHHFAVAGVVGDDQRLGRSGEQVDPDAAEQLSLGLGDEGVARPYQHIHRLDTLAAERHRAHRLHAAEAVDVVGPA